MSHNFFDHKIKKQFASIDRLITELVIIRKYINSARVSLLRCREHAARAAGSGNTTFKGDELIRNQERLLDRLMLAEKRIKKQLMSSSKELGIICGREKAAK